MREVYLLQIVGGDRVKLILLLPVSLLLNTVFVFIAAVVKVIASLPNPFLFLATLIDVPLVLLQAVFGGLATALSGQRVVPAEDINGLHSCFLESGEEIQHRVYGRCRLLERRLLNENNIVVARSLPSYLESKVQI